jgi:HD-GYP domain-containing protein (c-di-GMP phosphodiesterase class II)
MDEAQLVYGTLQGAMSALQATLEMMDHGTADEQQKIARLSIAIARELGLSREETTGIGLAAALHDIGKIYIPQGILDNPEDLTDVQMGIIQDHPEVGFNVLKTVELKIPKFPWPLAEIVLQHHERIDGSGYPQGLKGDEILLGARIIAVADVMVAMTTDRPHRKAPGLEKALMEIEESKGELYDPEVVDACLKALAEKHVSLA